MKKYKYFAVSVSASEYYRTKKQALADVRKTWGDDIVRLYTLKYEDDVQQLTSEDLIGFYQNGKKLKAD